MNILEAWSLSNTTHRSSPADRPWAVGMGLGGGVGGGGSGCRQRGSSSVVRVEGSQPSLLFLSPPFPLPGGLPRLLGDTGQIKASLASD